MAKNKKPDLVECTSDLAAAMQLTKDGRFEELMKRIEKAPPGDTTTLDALYLEFGIKMVRPIKSHTCSCGSSSIVRGRRVYK